MNKGHRYHFSALAIVGFAGATALTTALTTALNAARAQTTVDYANGSTNSTAFSTTTANPYTLNSLGTSTAYATQGGVLSGNGSITKTGPGTLLLAQPNTYLGGTVINGGAVDVMADNALGAAGTGITLNGGALKFSTIGFLTTMRDITLGSGGGTIDTGTFFIFTGIRLNGTISGSGALTVTSTGSQANSLSLSAANTYTGGTTIDGVAVAVNATGALGSGAVQLNPSVVPNRNSSLTFFGPTSAEGLAITLSGNTTSQSFLGFSDGATAGNANILASGQSLISFDGGSSAGASTIVNADIGVNGIGTQFGNGSSAGSADITNRSVLLAAGADLGTARFTNRGSMQLSQGTVGDTATITNQAGGTVDVSGNGALISIGSLSGAGNINLGATALTLGNLNLSEAISGVIADGGQAGGMGGSLTKIGSGTLTLSGANSYTGATTVAYGTLKAGAPNSLSALSDHTVAAGAALDLAGNSQTVASLANSGIVSLLGASPGTKLTVNGAYVGNGGTLAIGTVLNAGAGPSDQLVLNGAGASASGNTQVAVTNIGGLGAQTIGNGIPVVVALNGATSTATAFTLNGTHVDVGAFEYRLAGAADNSWYLTSTAAPAIAPVAPFVPAIPVMPVAPVDPGSSASPSLPASPAAPVTLPALAYRAEVALHNALPNVLRQGDLAMLSTMHRRIGDENRSMTVDGSDSGWGGLNRRAWGHVVGGNVDSRQAGVAGVQSHASMSGIQAGVDLYGSTRWNAGLYAGALRTDGRVNGNVGGLMGYAGSFRSDNTYVGAYGTYTDLTGFYTDMVLQYGMHDVSTAAPRTSSAGDADSLTASIEVGQPFGIGGNWAIEPQAQLIYNRLKLDTVGISGASVQQRVDNQTIGRLGIRITTDLATPAGRLQPYGRIDLWHGFSGIDTTSFVNAAANTPIATRIGYTSTELALGATLQITPTTSVYGEVGKLFKTGGNSDARLKSSVKGSAGVKLNF